jgi:hypothetical protein
MSGFRGSACTCTMAVVQIDLELAGDLLQYSSIYSLLYSFTSTLLALSNTTTITPYWEANLPEVPGILLFMNAQNVLVVES